MSSHLRLWAVAPQSAACSAHVFVDYLTSTGLPDLVVPVDLSHYFLAKDSAGGNLTHHVTQHWTAAPSSPICIASIILLQPYFGGEKRTPIEMRMEGVAPVANMRRSDWVWKAFLPEGSNRNHLAAHVTGEAGMEPGWRHR
ncbi:probable carboxylesterase 18 [Setaria viridis]|uniref:probable carboxylesterase 18 n=1 Tax=Setaria viridis TaxID=4556 RepID=UPI003B3A6A3F